MGTREMEMEQREVFGEREEAGAWDRDGVELPHAGRRGGGGNFARELAPPSV